jgi:hypothetical protein
MEELKSDIKLNMENKKFRKQKGSYFLHSMYRYMNREANKKKKERERRVEEPNRCSSKAKQTNRTNIHKGAI